MTDWDCKEGCSECCGLVPISELTVMQNEDKMQVIPTKKHVVQGDYNGRGNTVFFMTEDHKCVYLNRTTNRCMIYGQRPLVCRQYGRIPKLLCMYVDMAGRRRTEHEQKRVQTYMDKRTERLLKAAKEEVAKGKELTPLQEKWLENRGFRNGQKTEEKAPEDGT